jgi:hypothetical protein
MDFHLDRTFDPAGHFYTVAFAGEGVVTQKGSQWTNTQTISGVKGDDFDPTIAVDASGSVYIVYMTYDTINQYITIIKYNANGVQQWIRQRAVVMTAETVGTDLNPSIVFDGALYISYDTVLSSSEREVIIIKLGSNGNKLWDAAFGTLPASCRSNVTAHGGTIIVARSTPSQSIIVAAYDGDARILQWETTVDNAGGFPVCIVDPHTSAIVCSYTTINGRVGSVRLGVNGNLLWKTNTTLSTSIAETAPTTDVYGNVFVGSTGQNETVAVQKFNGVTGAVIWTKTVPVPAIRPATYWRATGDAVYVSYVVPGTHQLGSHVFDNAPPLLTFAARGGEATGGSEAATVTCFFANAMVLTPSGYKKISHLVYNELVVTGDGRHVPVRGVRISRVLASVVTNPYVIPRRMYGATRRVLISPEHRVDVGGGVMVRARDIGLQQEERHGVLLYYNVELPDWRRDTLVVSGVIVESLAPVRRVALTLDEFAAAMALRGPITPQLLERVRQTCRLLTDGRVEVPVFRR